MNQRVIADPSQHGWVEVDGKWVWDAESGGGAGAGMVISETEPTDKVEGMQWLNPTTGLVLFWDDEKWLQMPGSQDGADGADAVWSENANGANYTGTVTVNGELLAAKSGAGDRALAIGSSAGSTGQGAYTVAAGIYAGNSDQGESAVAVGRDAGRTDQGINATAVGFGAGNATQGESATALGRAAGMTNQGDYSIAIGREAGKTSQGDQGTAIGYYSGYENQGTSATALGYRSGCYGQGVSSIAIGEKAGETNQDQRSVAVGSYSAETSQGSFAVAVGDSAARENQGSMSIAIGHQAGRTNQAANGIIINSTGDAINNTGANHIQIQSAPTKYLLYNGTNAWTFSGGTVNGLNGFRQNGAPVIDAKGLISTLSTLRNATKDETTLEGMRDALADAIGGLIQNLEHEIATMPAQEAEE